MTTVPFTFEIGLMLALIGAALILFVLERFPIEVTAMSLLAVLVLIGFLEIDQALAGLSNKAVITVGALLVLSHALVKTGLLEIAADYLSEKAADNKWLGISIFLTVAAVLSGFLNNTAVVAIFIPLAVSLCRRFEISPSKVLMPLSYLSILGGTLTLIGTSTNLLVSAIAEDAGQPPLSMFEFTHLGAIFLILGILYVLIFAPRLLPDRVGVASLTGKYEMKPFLTELRVNPESEMVGKTVEELKLSETYGVTVLSIDRQGRRLAENLRREAIRPDDLLIVQGALDDVLQLRNDQNVALISDVKMTDEELSREGQLIVEVLVPPNSSLIGKTLKDVDFRLHYRAFVLAIRRHGETLHARLADIALRASDSMLVTVTSQRLRDLRQSDDLLVISEVDLLLKKRPLWWASLVVIPVIVLLAALGVVDILLGALFGVILLFLLGVIKTQESYRAVDWSVLFMIAAFVPVGDAMVNTGTADYIGQSIVRLGGMFSESMSLYVMLSATYLITMALTQMVSNNAAAIILTPVSISVATTLGVDPRPFIIAICFAGSAGFMTPIGYQTNMMVFGPGNYRFMDYVRYGAPLNIGYWLLASYLIPVLWPF